MFRKLLISVLTTWAALLETAADAIVATLPPPTADSPRLRVVAPVRLCPQAGIGIGGNRAGIDGRPWRPAGLTYTSGTTGRPGRHVEPANISAMMVSVVSPLLATPPHAPGRSGSASLSRRTNRGCPHGVHSPPHFRILLGADAGLDPVGGACSWTTLATGASPQARAGMIAR